MKKIFIMSSCAVFCFTIINNVQASKYINISQLNIQKTDIVHQENLLNTKICHFISLYDDLMAAAEYELDSQALHNHLDYFKEKIKRIRLDKAISPLKFSTFLIDYFQSINNCCKSAEGDCQEIKSHIYSLPLKSQKLFLQFFLNMQEDDRRCLLLDTLVSIDLTKSENLKKSVTLHDLTENQSSISKQKSQRQFPLLLYFITLPVSYDIYRQQEAFIIIDYINLKYVLDESRLNFCLDYLKLVSLLCTSLKDIHLGADTKVAYDIFCKNPPSITYKEYFTVGFINDESDQFSNQYVSVDASTDASIDGSINASADDLFAKVFADVSDLTLNEYFLLDMQRFLFTVIDNNYYSVTFLEIFKKLASIILPLLGDKMMNLAVQKSLFNRHFIEYYLLIICCQNDAKIHTREKKERGISFLNKVYECSPDKDAVVICAKDLARFDWQLEGKFWQKYNNGITFIALVKSVLSTFLKEHCE